MLQAAVLKRKPPYRVTWRDVAAIILTLETIVLIGIGAR
jgi:hypothetical protein